MALDFGSEFDTDAAVLDGTALGGPIDWQWRGSGEMYGFTPLLIAISRDDIAVATSLLKRGALLSPPFPAILALTLPSSKLSALPLDSPAVPWAYAVKCGRHELAKLLMDSMPNILLQVVREQASPVATVRAIFELCTLAVRTSTSTNDYNYWTERCAQLANGSRFADGVLGGMNGGGVNEGLRAASKVEIDANGEIKEREESNDTADATPLTTPLMEAVTRGDVDVANLLMDHGADANVVCKGGLAAVHMAAMHCESTLLTALIAHGADVMQPVGPSAVLTLVHGTPPEERHGLMARRWGALELFERFAMTSCRARSQMAEGANALVLAASSAVAEGRDSSVAEADAEAPRPPPPQVTISLKLKQHVPPEPPSFQFVKVTASGWVTVAEDAVRLGKDKQMGSWPSLGQQVLQLAVKGDTVLAALRSLLIAYPALVSFRGREGQTALFTACASASEPLETVRLLLKHHAAVDMVDYQGRTPLMIVASRELTPNFISTVNLYRKLQSIHQSINPSISTHPESSLL
uniref:Uncharacterized protein n=1 Tax=Haptolina brevifila TaxID=156173 RepID=A0A7S2JHB0_9EUKA|mmetsp:Transcript_82484/g.164434  ORF Transcript_82484/g.164434 Transcript_82484/m.164434 type:complete len:524 (+) Transcript_82484:215-1786(+)